MATTNVTLDLLESFITSADTVLIDFGAPWCGPCRQFGPVFEAASEHHPEIAFGKVDTDAEQQLFLMLAEPRQSPNHIEESPCVDALPAGPVARPPGPDAATTLSRHSLVCPSGIAARATRKPQRKASWRPCSAARPAC